MKKPALSLRQGGLYFYQTDYYFFEVIGGKIYAVIVYSRRDTEKTALPK